MKVPYYVMNPSGNLTLLLRQQSKGSFMRETVWAMAASAMMKTMPEIEQAGYFTFPEDEEKLPVLKMAGGEFCGNASMAAGVLWGILKEKTIPCSVSIRCLGTPEPVRVSVNGLKDGRYDASVTMPLPESIETLTLAYGGRSFTLPLVRFAGIAHLIAPYGMLEGPEAEKAVKLWCAELKVSGLGLLFCRGEDDGTVLMDPLVYIPAIPSLFWEGSCASGTAALAYARFSDGGGGSLTVRQKKGTLRAEADPEGHVVLSGLVSLEKEGRLDL